MKKFLKNVCAVLTISTLSCFNVISLDYFSQLNETSLNNTIPALDQYGDLLSQLNPIGKSGNVLGY